MRKIFLIIIFCLANIIALAQVSPKNGVRGKVYFISSTKEKQAAQFASLSWVEGRVSVETNTNGEFSINKLSGDNITLIASFIGYTKDTVVIKKSGNWKVKFVSDNGIEKSLDQTLIEGNNKPYLEFFIKDENELNNLVVTGRQEANYLSKMTPIRTEVISAAGLCKMACCSLAESFENSASVSVGYSDAVTGAKQIKLLGLSGSYTQMLDENRPVMRGLASPFGLSYIPGQWLESIQIAKGPSSVINGLEAITGQINMEHRKPTAENPLFVNLFLNQNLKSEINVASSLPIGKKWSTVIMGHVSMDALNHDTNHDSFRDEPFTQRYSLDNRWLYLADNGMQLRFGVKGISENRVGGQMDYKKGMNDRGDGEYIYGEAYSKQIWGSEIKNRGIDAFVKLGIPLNKENTRNIAIVGDYNYYKMNSSFGIRDYDGYQNMAYMNVMFMDHKNDVHKYTLGLSGRYDNINENLYDRYVSANKVVNSYLPLSHIEKALGMYGEYTLSLGEKCTLVAGLRADYDFNYGWLVAPRANIKYAFTPNTIVRANAGRGFRTPNIIADNLGVLSTGRKIVMEGKSDIEDAWTFGGNFTQHFKLGATENSYISFDYFHTSFNNRLIVDWDKFATSTSSLSNDNSIAIYNSTKRSFTDTYQLDLSLEPIERFTIITTFRYTNAKITLDGQGLVEAPLTSKYKGVLNLQYATRMRKCVFDFTAQVNGPSKMPQFMGGENSPVYPMLYAQVTRKFKNVEVYIGGENLTNYTQDYPIILPDKPYSQGFNASMVWGPLMGTMVYAGMRLTLWR